MPLLATTDLRGSCPKKKDDPEGEQVGFNIEARTRVPSSVPRYMVETWLRSKHVVRVDPDTMKDQSNATDDFWDAYDDWPEDIAPMMDATGALPKAPVIDAKKNQAEAALIDAKQKATIQQESQALAETAKQQKQK